MNKHTEHIHAMVDGKGRATVKILPGKDTAEDVIFNKEDLQAEIEVLIKGAASAGYQIGRQSIQDKFRELLGIKS